MRTNGKRVIKSYIPNRNDALLYLDAAIAQERANAMRYRLNVNLCHDARTRAHLEQMEAVALVNAARLTDLREQVATANVALIRP